MDYTIVIHYLNPNWLKARAIPEWDKLRDITKDYIHNKLKNIYETGERVLTLYEKKEEILGYLEKLAWLHCEFYKLKSKGLEYKNRLNLQQRVETHLDSFKKFYATKYNIEFPQISLKAR